ncbi:hypothetical protein EGW08_016367 [Elysia chlorotica]|uniref:Uncharacterized protein n=1 Tax=Elysia chlorotica TaxID=188477 RepID=A0A3S1BVJ5_ELYCH|nr:hypothetical protein EGW08_016367 [Elysia chlorotica]
MLRLFIKVIFLFFVCLIVCCCWVFFWLLCLKACAGVPSSDEGHPGSELICWWEIHFFLVSHDRAQYFLFSSSTDLFVVWYGNLLVVFEYMYILCGLIVYTMIKIGMYNVC